MSSKIVKVAIAGIGNNISALLQGIYYYRQLKSENPTCVDLPGVRRPYVGPYGVEDIQIVVAFDVGSSKVGKDLSEAIFSLPNRYPKIANVPFQGITVKQGPRLDGVPSHLQNDFSPVSEQEILEFQKTVVDELRTSGADVFLYSLPTGCPVAAEFYANCALDCGLAFVNCTPEEIGRNENLRSRYEEKCVPLIGDDLASHIGSSVVHKTLLQLIADRGITLTSSYQTNLGGNTDFKNLLIKGQSKAVSKKNALAGAGVDLSLVDVVPSGGFIPGLGDCKVGIINIEGVGWGGTQISLDLKLKVQDSSNAAGVIVDLIRIGALAREAEVGGFISGSAYLLKSPPAYVRERSDVLVEQCIDELQQKLPTFSSRMG